MLPFCSVFVRTNAILPFFSNSNSLITNVSLVRTFLVSYTTFFSVVWGRNLIVLIRLLVANWLCKWFTPSPSLFSLFPFSFSNNWFENNSEQVQYKQTMPTTFQLKQNTARMILYIYRERGWWQDWNRTHRSIRLGWVYHIICKHWVNERNGK